MTFELSAEQQAARDRARAVARERVAPASSGIDEGAAIPQDLLREVQEAIGTPADAVTLAVVTEELATASAATAAAGALRQSSNATVDGNAPGLRGLAVPRTADARGRLVFAAVALGIARAAIDTAIALVRQNARGAEEPEKPHWVVADAATDVEAARMLTLRAAQAVSHSAEPDGAVAMAKLAASAAAQRALDAALRVAGPGGFARGTLLERLSRDVRAVSLLLGTEEDLRAAAANSLLPG